MSSDASTWVGQTIAGRYEVIELLGEGGMGQVYKAEDRNLQTHVVIKVPHKSMLADAEFKKRFSREVRSLVALSHPHVVKIQDVGEHDGVPFAVMQFLPGGDLHSRYSSGGADPVAASGLESWIEPIARALDFIHRQDYVHRDIKPDNIMFDVDANPYVGDFGIAKALGDDLQKKGTGRLTQEGVALGTPEYMAPEVIMGEDFDGRADLYSLAATVHEMLCGTPPFEGRTPAAIIVQATTKSPPAPHTVNNAVPKNLSEAIVKGLSKNAADRFADCASFARAILAAVRTPVMAAVPPPVAPAPDPPATPPKPKTNPRQMRPTGDTAPQSSGDTGAHTPPPVPVAPEKQPKPFSVPSKRETQPPSRSPTAAPSPERRATPPPPKPEKKRKPQATPFGQSTAKPVAESPPVVPPAAPAQRPTQVPPSRPAQVPRRKRPRPAGAATPKKSQQQQRPAAPAPAAQKPRSRRWVGWLVALGLIAGGGVGGWFAYYFFLPKVVVVSKDGTGSYTSIREAVENAKPNTRIEVKPGRYTERRLTLKQSVKIVGEADPSKVVVTLREPIIIDGGDVELTGLTLRGIQPANSAKNPAAKSSRAGVSPTRATAGLIASGRTGRLAFQEAAPAGAAKQPVPQLPDVSDSTIYIKSGSPVIDNCEISSENAAAIGIRGADVKPTIRKCKIVGAKTSGLIVALAGGGRVEDCEFSDCKQCAIQVFNGSLEFAACRVAKSGVAGVLVSAGTPVFSDCTFREQSVGAKVIDTGNPVFSKCRFADMSLYGVSLQGQARLEDCSFRNCRLYGVRCSSGANVNLIDCTIDGTNSSIYGVRVYDSQVSIKDCRIRNHTKYGVYAFIKANVTIENSDLSANTLSRYYKSSSAKVVIDGGNKRN